MLYNFDFFSAFFYQRYCLFKRTNRLKPPKDLEKTKYIQSYVNLLSKAIYWWITDILIVGYKRPLEMTDLGELPKSERAFKQYKKLQTVFDAEKVTFNFGFNSSVWEPR